MCTRKKPGARISRNLYGSSGILQIDRHVWWNLESTRTFSLMQVIAIEHDKSMLGIGTSYGTEVVEQAHGMTDTE